MKPYTLLYPKSWKDLKYRNLQDVKIVKGERLDLSKYPQIRRQIDKEWLRRKKANQRIFSGALCRLSGYSIGRGGLVLELGGTNYKELVGTNYASSSDKKREKSLQMFFYGFVG